ncbi:hypothetical protein GN244_ATG05994 [Phytophthora infestans]|uniref:Uncharacterized protein n=1 Tax=Phytophthora infestans TaxID=4787 RepID=A0A833W4A1_PHYIN|nr:hypothetical protein GN244_ATG05994 [Phytophthora infestans]
MVGPTCKQCEAKINPLLLDPQWSTTDFRTHCVCCGKLQYGYAPYNQRAGHRAALYCLRERPKSD